MKHFATLLISGVVLYYLILALETYRTNHDTDDKPCSCLDKKTTA